VAKRGGLFLIQPGLFLRSDRALTSTSGSSQATSLESSAKRLIPTSQIKRSSTLLKGV
jgi:hypothetical protein